MANKIIFRVLADTKDFQDRFKKLNQTAKKLTRNATISFVAFGAAISVATKLAKDQQKVMNQTKAVLKSTGNVAGITAEEVFKLGKEMQNLTTFGDETVISATNMLLTFKEISGDVMPRAVKAVLDVSVAMDQGLKESAIQLGKALNDPILGLTAMRRVGIQFSKTQEEQIKLLTQTGKASEAQGLILEELESQFGGSAEAARKGLGAIDALKNSLGDFAENIALVMAPSIERMALALTDMIDVIKENKAVVTLVASFLLLGAVLSALLVIVGAVVSAITTIGPVIAAIVGGSVVLIGELIAAFVLFRGEVKETDEALSGEEGVFTRAKKKVEELDEAMQGMVERARSLAEEGSALGRSILAGLSAGFGIDLGTVSVGGEGESAAPPFIQGFEAGLVKIEERINNITELGKQMAFTFQKSLSTAFSDLILQLKSAKEVAIEFGKNLLGAIVKFISEWLAFQVLSKAQALVSQTFAIGLAASLAAAWAPAAALASLASFGSNAAPAQSALASTVALSRFLSVPAFQEGAVGLKDDTLGLFNRRETVIPATFSDAIRSGELSLVGGDGEQGGQIVFDFSGASFNGITEEFVEDIFTKASENIANNTLLFRST